MTRYSSRMRPRVIPIFAVGSALRTTLTVFFGSSAVATSAGLIASPTLRSLTPMRFTGSVVT